MRLIISRLYTLKHNILHSELSIWNHINNLVSPLAKDSLFLCSLLRVSAPWMHTTHSIEEKIRVLSSESYLERLVVSITTLFAITLTFIGLHYEQFVAFIWLDDDLILHALNKSLFILIIQAYK